MFDMVSAHGRERTCSALEAARAAGISKNTLLRWLRQGKVPEVARDRNGWRIFTARDIAAVTAFAQRTTPPAAGGPGGTSGPGRSGADAPAGGEERQVRSDSAPAPAGELRYLPAAAGAQDAVVVSVSNGDRAGEAA